MRNFLTRMMATITRHPRYHPEEHELDHKTHWSSKVWVSNLFRAYEYLFGRGYGVRPEASTQVIKKDGKLYVTRHFFTLEALLAHVEVTIRGYFSLFPSFFKYPLKELDYRQSLQLLIF